MRFCGQGSRKKGCSTSPKASKSTLELPMYQADHSCNLISEVSSGFLRIQCPRDLSQKTEPWQHWSLKKVLFGTPSTPTLFRGYLALQVSKLPNLYCCMRFVFRQHMAVRVGFCANRYDWRCLEYVGGCWFSVPFYGITWSININHGSTSFGNEWTSHDFTLSLVARLQEPSKINEMSNVSFEMFEREISHEHLAHHFAREMFNR